VPPLVPYASTLPDLAFIFELSKANTGLIKQRGPPKKAILFMKNGE
jgi:hypothetical protein